MKRDLAYPMRFDGSLSDEYRQHRARHGRLRDFFYIGWLTFWITAGIVGVLLLGSAT